MPGQIFYNKLVRDRIKEKIEGKGEACEVRVIEGDEEFKRELLKKVVEEARELAASDSRDAFLSEYADLMAALDALADLYEFSEADIRTAISENMEKKGGFKKRHFLIWS